MPTTTAAPAQQQRSVLEKGFSSFPSFCGLLDIVPKSGQRQKLELNEIQKKYCETRTARDVVLKPRQIGFTTEEQARDLWHFLTVPGARVVVTAQSMTDHSPSRLLSKNYDVMLESLGALGLVLDIRSHGIAGWSLPKRDATLRIVEAGASEKAAQKKGRAGTITRLHLTETAFYEYADETLNALEECVPKSEYGSEIVSESTPNGAAGLFYESCKQAQAGRSGYKFHFFPWFEASEYALPLDPGEKIIPENDRERGLVAKHRITAEQLKWYRRKLAEKRGNQDLVDQEYPSDPETCFLASGRTFFLIGTLNALAKKTRDPIKVSDRDRVRIFKNVEAGAIYMIGGDTSEGIPGRDESAAALHRVDTGEHVATIQGTYAAYEFAEALYKLARVYSNAYIAVERNNHGHAVIEALVRTFKYARRLYVHEDKKFGWPTNDVTRPMMLDKLHDSQQRGTWSTPDAQLIAQMRTFVVNKNGKPEAQTGAHDDLVMAEAVAWGVLTMGRVWTRFLPDNFHG